MPLDPSQYLSSVWQPGIFKSKVVFCTGGNGTICSAQVRALVHLGADACIVGRNKSKTESMATDIATARPGAKVIGIGEIDVRNTEALSAAVDRCVQELGGIDFLIAGAAGNFLAPMAQLSMNAFKTVMDIDVMGSYNTTKLCLPHLLKAAQKQKETGKASSPSGRIIYVSATLHYTGTPLQTHVAVAKAGVDSLSNNVAIEYGPFGLTSNVIAPGPIAGTEGMDRLSKRPQGGGSEKVLAKAIPLGRWGLVKEIADATIFLFSDAANYVTGTTVVVDGGAWRNSTGLGSDGFAYPDFLISGAEVTGVGGLKKTKGTKL